MNAPMPKTDRKANTEPIVDRKGNSITCPDCGGIGYKGRTGIFEVLVVTDREVVDVLGRRGDGLHGGCRKTDQVVAQLDEPTGGTWPRRGNFELELCGAAVAAPNRVKALEIPLGADADRPVRVHRGESALRASAMSPEPVSLWPSVCRSGR